MKSVYRDDPQTYWQRREAASQRALAQAQEENRVNRECLKLAIDALEAINALKWEVETKWLKMHVDSALNEIEVRLAELKPEGETG